MVKSQIWKVLFFNKVLSWKLGNMYNPTFYLDIKKKLMTTEKLNSLLCLVSTK